MAKKTPDRDLTNALLKAGVLAGPLYVVVGFMEILTRPGFDMRKHSLSLMSIGPMGWVHVSLFVVTGLLVILGAFGIRRAIKGEKALRQGSGQAGKWAPILLGVYGASLISAGIFVPDAMKGFPPGMAHYGEFSLSGCGHLVSGMIGFSALIAACFIFGKRFKHLKDMQQGMLSVFTGFIFLIGFMGIAIFSASPNDTVVAVATLFFYFAVLLSWIWLSTISAKLMK